MDYELVVDRRPRPLDVLVDLDLGDAIRERGRDLRHRVATLFDDGLVARVARRGTLEVLRVVELPAPASDPLREHRTCEAYRREVVLVVRARDPGVVGHRVQLGERVFERAELRIQRRFLGVGGEHVDSGAIHFSIALGVGTEVRGTRREVERSLRLDVRARRASVGRLLFGDS